MNLTEATTTLLVLGLLSSLSSTARSQSVLNTFDGDSTGDSLGVSVSEAGDVNRDGFADLIVGAFKDDNNGSQSGSARVYSGRDGSILYTFDGDSAGDRLGESVSGGGDVNSDGYPDLIAGATLDDNNGPDSGSARVFSGLDGSILYTFNGHSAGDQFGHSVGAAGDVNGDGYADVVVGAAQADNNGPASGSAHVISGFDGATLYTFDGDSAGDTFGESVNGAGDVNADGYADLVVGAERDDNNGSNAGSARVFSGLDGSILYTFNGDSSGDGFGVSVSGAGDVNADGYADLVVGAERDDNNGSNSGSTRVFSGLDGSILYTFNGDADGDFFGVAVSGAGDVNGDGFDDLVVGAFRGGANGGGYARVLSGIDGSILYTVDGDSANDEFGNSVDTTRDVNGDGFDDVVVGAQHDDNGGPGSGSARVFSGCDPLGNAYCSPALVNSTGQPAGIHACGSDTVSDNRFSISASWLPLSSFGYFLNSQSQGFAANPGGSQGNLCLGGSVGRFLGPGQVLNSGAAGAFSLAVDLNAVPTPTGFVTVQPGETWNFQAWYRDANPGPTSNFTDAVTVTFQ